jgi:hypothetical protein
VIGGNDSQALKDIDFSLLVLLEKAEAYGLLLVSELKIIV